MQIDNNALSTLLVYCEKKTVFNKRRNVEVARGPLVLILVSSPFFFETFQIGNKLPLAVRSKPTVDSFHAALLQLPGPVEKTLLGHDTTAVTDTLVYCASGRVVVAWCIWIYFLSFVAFFDVS